MMHFLIDLFIQVLVWGGLVFVVCFFIYANISYRRHVGGMTKAQRKEYEESLRDCGDW
jgi:hypothetical protein